MAASAVRLRLRRELAAHIARLGYSSQHLAPPTALKPEIARVSPVRRRIAYGETVLRGDLRRPRCHERLRFFSQRRTRQGSSILFFIGVAADDRQALEELLSELEIRDATRGGHVHIVPIEVRAAKARRPAASRARC